MANNLSRLSKVGFHLIAQRVAMNAKIKMTTFRKLAAMGDLAPLMIQLMMAINDIGIADHGMEHWSKKAAEEHPGRAQASRSYFVRLQMAHAFEALKVIHKIGTTPEYKAVVEKCDRRTQEAFARAFAVIGTDDYKAMKRLRNSVSFHYETKAIQESLKRQSKKFPDFAMPMSIGSRTIDWHFDPGDRVVDGIIVRDAIGVPEDKDVRTEVDKVAVRLQAIAEDLATFAGYFVHRYCT
jgi:hypothetical protein